MSGERLMYFLLAAMNGVLALCCATVAIIHKIQPYNWQSESTTTWQPFGYAAGIASGLALLLFFFAWRTRGKENND